MLKAKKEDKLLGLWMQRRCIKYKRGSKCFQLRDPKQQFQRSAYSLVVLTTTKCIFSDEKIRH